MASDKHQDMHSWNPIPDTKRYTAFNTDKFTIHGLYDGNPMYSDMMNQQHTNMVFYDKALPYPTQPDADYISRTDTKKAATMQTGILLDNPVSYMAYMDTSHFKQCGGYYFLAFYDQALYHKARLVARFSEKDKPTHEGWTPEFSCVIMDRFLVRVFVSKKTNEDTGRKDAKLCVYNLGDLTKKHGLGPKNWFDAEPSTTCQLLITMPIPYTKPAFYGITPAWKWITSNNSLYCMHAGQITAYTLVLVTDESGKESIHVTTNSVHNEDIHCQCLLSVSEDGSKLFISKNHAHHNHDLYGYEYYDYNDPGCTVWSSTRQVFNIPELTQSELPMDSNWILDDVASLNKSDKDEFILTFHNPSNNKRNTSIVTPFTLDTGLIVHYTHMNATPGRHYVIVGACSGKTSFVYTLDESDNAIYTYQLPSNIPDHILTKFDIAVFGDGQLMIGGFRHPHSLFCSEKTTYAINPTLLIDTLTKAPIPGELIQLAIGYL